MPHVDILVDRDLINDTGIAFELLGATEVGRTEDAYSDVYRVTLDMPYVPSGATLVTPCFETRQDGIRVQSLSWTYAAPLAPTPTSAGHAPVPPTSSGARLRLDHTTT